MRTGIRFLFLATGFAVLTFFGVRYVQTEAAAPAGTAFLATFVEKHYDDSGREVRTEDSLMARGSDGSATIFLRQDPAGRPVQMKTVVLYSAGQRISVDPMTESITTYSLTPKEVAIAKFTQPNCTDQSAPETTSIAGFTAVRTVVPIPEGAKPIPTIWEQWLAPELGCLPLRVRITAKNSGQVRVLREVVFVVLGEPPASVFEVPINYAERSPSEVFAEFERRFPGHSAAGGNTGARLDDAYRKRK